jgi:hypothetical protein
LKSDSSELQQLCQVSKLSSKLLNKSEVVENNNHTQSKTLRGLKSMLTESLRLKDRYLAYVIVPAKSNVAVIANESVLEVV